MTRNIYFLTRTEMAPGKPESLPKSSDDKPGDQDKALLPGKSPGVSKLEKLERRFEGWKDEIQTLQGEHEGLNSIENGRLSGGEEKGEDLERELWHERMDDIANEINMALNIVPGKQLANVINLNIQGSGIVFSFHDEIRHKGELPFSDWIESIAVTNVWVRPDGTYETREDIYHQEGGVDFVTFFDSRTGKTDTYGPLLTGQKIDIENEDGSSATTALETAEFARLVQERSNWPSTE